MASSLQQYIGAVAQLRACGQNPLVSVILFGSAATFVCIRSRTWPLNMRRFVPQLNVLARISHTSIVDWVESGRRK